MQYNNGKQLLRDFNLGKKGRMEEKKKTSQQYPF